MIDLTLVVVFLQLSATPRVASVKKISFVSVCARKKQCFFRRRTICVRWLCMESRVFAAFGSNCHRIVGYWWFGRPSRSCWPRTAMQHLSLYNSRYCPRLVHALLLSSMSCSFFHGKQEMLNGKVLFLWWIDFRRLLTVSLWKWFDDGHVIAILLTRS